MWVGAEGEEFLGCRRVACQGGGFVLLLFGMKRMEVLSGLAVKYVPMHRGNGFYISLWEIYV